MSATVPKQTKISKMKKLDERKAKSTQAKEPKHLARDESDLEEINIHYLNQWKGIKLIHTQFISAMSN